MSFLSSIPLTTWLGLIIVLLVFIVFVCVNLVNKSVGFGMARQLFMMKKKINKNKILLKILVPNGKPEFKIKEVAPIINYTYKENSISKQGRVIYDYYCVTELFGVKVLECRTDDVFPRNPYIDTSLTISGEVFIKNAVDASKQDFSTEGLRKFLKLALPIVIAIGVIMILYSQNQADIISSLTKDIAACYSNIPKEATIIGQ